MTLHSLRKCQKLVTSGHAKQNSQAAEDIPRRGLY